MSIWRLGCNQVDELTDPLENHVHRHRQVDQLDRLVESGCDRRDSGEVNVRRKRAGDTTASISGNESNRIDVYLNNAPKPVTATMNHFSLRVKTL